MNNIRVVSKRVYEVNDHGKKQWVLILFDISGFHYVGLRVVPDETKSTLYFESIKKFVELYGIREYSKSMIVRCIYEKRKPLEVNEIEFTQLYHSVKNSLLRYLDQNVRPNVDGVTYLKWCKDKYILNSKYNNDLEIHQYAIYWINLGYGVGSEVRKIRPAIVWRLSSDRSMCTIIPLTSKKYGDKYYFHCDLERIQNSTAKIENIGNLSRKRILSPYYRNDTLCYLTDKDKSDISSAIERYYLFRFDN